jgi:uncharacterized repeat protein (TIGR02543 family)
MMKTITKLIGSPIIGLSTVFATLICIFSGCSDSGDHPTVTEVVVTPDNTVVVGKGQIQDFFAEVKGDYDPPQKVIWSVKGAYDENTKFGADGIASRLTVGSQERPGQLTIVATSDYDRLKSGNVTITISEQAALPTIFGPSDIIGIGKVGQVLTADITDTTTDDIFSENGYWTYQWKRGDEADKVYTIIPGEVNKTYTPGLDDEGKYLTVTIIRAGDTGGKTSPAIGKILKAGDPVPTGGGTINVLSPTDKAFKGKSIQLVQSVPSATAGIPAAEQGVFDWKITSSHSAGTSIAEDGTLTVAADETENTLDIVATSTADHSKIVKGNIQLYVKVSFKSDRADDTIQGTLEIKSGDPIPSTVDDAGVNVREHYDFDGWYYNETPRLIKWVSTNTFGKDTTLYAGWTPTQYTITYNMNGGVQITQKKYTIEDQAFDLPTNVTPTNGRDIFDGWYTDNGTFRNRVTRIETGSHGDMLVFAKWIPRTLTNIVSTYYWVNEQGDISFTNGLAQGTISRTSGNTLTITAQDTGYTGQKWYVNGIEDVSKRNASSFAFSGLGKAIGTYVVGLQVSKDAAYYYAEFKVEVTN